jgi:hypothetical protein
MTGLSGLRFGVDVGGTFTDVVALNERTQRQMSVKVPTIPDAQNESVIAGIRRLLPAGERVMGVIHGTTAITNAILEGRGASVALITTEGFRDVLEIGRQSRDTLYNLDRPGRAEPLVPPPPPIRSFRTHSLRRQRIKEPLGRVERRGDIYAQRPSTNVAAQRVQELFERYPAPVVLGCFERFIDESDLQMRAALDALPDGTWLGEDWLDDDGITNAPLRIRVAVSIAGDRARCDFTGTDAQTPGPVNTTYFITCPAVYYVCRALLGPDIPANAGCYRALEVIVPPGSLLNPGPEAPVVGGNHETSRRVADALFKAFAQVMPKRVVAGGITSSGLALFTGRWSDGRAWVLYETHGGGEGAGAQRDGTSAVRVHMSNVMNTPTEVIEAEYPLHIERHELRNGSGGAGRQAGFTSRCHFELIESRARRDTHCIFIRSLTVRRLFRFARTHGRLSGGQQPIELAALGIRQVPRECVVRVLQANLVSSGDQVAEHGATRPNDPLFERPSVCSSAQGLGPRRAAGKSGEVVEQALPLGTVTAHKAEMAANALEMRPAGLVIARVVGDEHRQQAQLRGQHLEHGRGHLSRISQEVAAPAQDTAGR